MRKYRFIFQMCDDKEYAVIASNNLDAAILVQAWFIMHGLKYELKSWDIDVAVDPTENLGFNLRYKAACDICLVAKKRESVPDGA